MLVIVIDALEILILLFGLGYIFISIDTLLNHRKHRVVYVGSNFKECTPVLEEIIANYIPSTQDVLFIEPGAGTGHIARFLAKKYPWKKLIALETSFPPYIVGWAASIWQRTPIQYLRQNLMDYPYPSGALLYCYLSTDILGKLHSENRFKGCMVVSLTFAIPNITPTKEYPLSTWQSKLLFYDFRQA